MAPGFRGQSTRKPAGPTVEGEAPPGADEASLFRGWPPNSGYAVSAVWLGPTVYSCAMGAKRIFRHAEAAIADGHGPFCGGCFFCGAAWAILLKGNGFSPGFVRFLPKFKKSSCIVHRCTVYDFIAKKEAGCKWMLNGSGGRPDDISCRKKDVSCRRPHKSQKDAILNI